MDNIKESIKKYNIRITKSLGQNFLINDMVVEKIVEAAELEAEDLVIEIGPGTGSMTGELAAKAGWVIAIEIDRHLIPALQENLKGVENVRIINRDVMELNLRQLIQDKLDEEGTLKKVKVVANLPYYITTPIIMKLLEEDLGIESAVFMVQKEVADRMAAKPGGKDYGALSVAVQFYSNPEKIFKVPPHCFIPQPEVDSQVIRLNIYKSAPVGVEDKNMFFRTVKAAFGQRRKTLVNALYNSGYFMQNKDEITEILKSIGIEANQRGETLSIMQFAKLSNAFFLKKS